MQNNMDEQQIRKIVQEELMKNQYSGIPVIPRHTHDGVNSPHINQGNITPNTVFNGTISMTQGTITGAPPNQVINWANYLLPTPSTISHIKFYGGALNTTADPKKHAMIIGDCVATGGYTWQPGTSNSVSRGNVLTKFIQGSQSFNITNSKIATSVDATAILINSQSYIAYTADGAAPSGNILAVARVFAYDGKNLTIQTAFASNWSLTGLWIVT